MKEQNSNHEATTNPMKITLVGNGSYQNRGCEAIVRGTMEILRSEFGNNLRINAGVFADHNTIVKQNTIEVDDHLQSFSMSGSDARWSRTWLATKLNRVFRTQFKPHLWQVDAQSSRCEAVLQIGGDNYSLDYGLPIRFMEVDKFIQRKRIPVAIWGASVGPFDQRPEHKELILDHLRNLNGIFVREKRSFDYLRSNGVEENVFHIADPAFVMPPRKPSESLEDMVEDGCIGINLSPLVGRFLSGKRGNLNLEDWTDQCAKAVAAVAHELKRPILLIPHVSSTSAKRCDFQFLADVRERVGKGTPAPIRVITQRFAAAEMKWIIGQCSIFAGARTHSTIAALGCEVPTLSIAYSVKALGLNEDIFGNTDLCLSTQDFTVQKFVDSVCDLADQESKLRSQLLEVMPSIRNRAINAGPLLRRVIGQSRS